MTYVWFILHVHEKCAKKKGKETSWIWNREPEWLQGMGNIRWDPESILFHFYEVSCLAWRNFTSLSLSLYLERVTRSFGLIICFSLPLTLNIIRSEQVFDFQKLGVKGLHCYAKPRTILFENRYRFTIFLDGTSSKALAKNNDVPILSFERWCWLVNKSSIEYRKRKHKRWDLEQRVHPFCQIDIFGLFVLAFFLTSKPSFISNFFSRCETLSDIRRS